MQYGAMSWAEVREVTIAVASALQYAHEDERIIHCDLKPNNLIIPKDGLLRVVDFGVARAMGRATGKWAGTPRYMSIEQRQRLDLTPATDIWALGVTIRDLAGAPHPYAHLENIDGSPEDIRLAWPTNNGDRRLKALCDSMLSIDPADRPTASDILSDLRIKTIVPDAVEVERPFVGLSGFLEDTSEFYFGREGELAKALERLRATPSLAIVGASGVGKTSFVRAGISTQLRARGWATICVRPSREPFRGLARALCDYANGSRELDRNYVEQLAEQLKDPDEKALAASLHRLVTFTQTAICLIVDQLDELYTHSDNKVQHAFLATLLTATDDATDRVRIVLSLRDDFMGKAVGLENVMILEPLGDADIRKVLKEPLRRVGYSFEDEALIDEIVKDVEATDVGLPFLQFTCEKLWDHRDRDQRVLLRRAYERFGGVEGAIADQGNKVLRALTSSKQLVARKLLIRLVTPQDTRRVMPRGELLDRLGPDASDVLLELINARLLATRVPIGEDEPTIELAHEALIRRWKQL
ncbi:MAG: protein kinase, partial [Myxococcota bacterium]